MNIEDVQEVNRITRYVEMLPHEARCRALVTDAPQLCSCARGQVIAMLESLGQSF